MRGSAGFGSVAPTSLRGLANNRRARCRFPHRRRGIEASPPDCLHEGHEIAHFPASTFKLGSTTFTTASLIQRLQKLSDAIIALNLAQAVAKDALSALQAAQEDVDPVVAAYKRFVFATCFDSTSTLADFNLTPPRSGRRGPSSRRRSPRRS